MDIKVIEAISLALIHFTDSSSKLQDINEFVTTTVIETDTKLVFMAVIYFYKAIHMSKKKFRVDARFLWIGCLLTAYKHNSNIPLHIETWSIITGIKVRDICVVVRDIHALLGHRLHVNAKELDQFTVVFSEMATNS